MTTKVALVGSLFLATVGIAHASGEALRLHHIQVVGTHNSYHVEPPPEIFDAVSSVTREVDGWAYTHAPLNVQLDRGVRNFELDLHPFVEGFEVMHVPLVDPGSTCPVFHDCLAVVRAWSQRNPRHIPISFLLEFKLQEATLAGKPLRDPDAAMLEAVEAEILSVFPREQLIAPDDLRGDAATLSEAVRTMGWPLLEEALGKVFFVLHNRSTLRAAYTENRPSLEGRLMFVNSSPDRDDAAFLVVDNPYSDRIPELLAHNMIIRVRSDGGLVQGRTGDTGRREAAFASGAHIISTDFPRGQAHPDTGYVVEFANGAPARCSPVNSPPDCEEQLHAFLPASLGQSSK